MKCYIVLYSIMLHCEVFHIVFLSVVQCFDYSGVKLVGGRGAKAGRNTKSKEI